MSATQILAQVDAGRLRRALEGLVGSALVFAFGPSVVRLFTSWGWLSLANSRVMAYLGLGIVVLVLVVGMS